MNILIIGLGYAGNRFRKALEQLKIEDERFNFITIAYSNPKPKACAMIYYDSIDKALSKFKPDIIINSANDIYHIDVIGKLVQFKGFLLNEKPLIAPGQNIDLVISSLRNISGFAMDMVSRYSDTTNKLKEYVQTQDLELVRLNFIWGKNRLEDHRPTCGVGSEIIHSLDLIQYILGFKKEVSISDTVSVMSDFSVSGASVFDTVHLTGHYNNAVIDGYASFVNIDRQRNLDFTFRNTLGDFIYAQIIYDTPVWDADILRVWRRDVKGKSVNLLRVETFDNQVIREADGLHKIKKLLASIIDYHFFKEKPRIEFCCLATSVYLHNLISEIYGISTNSLVTNYHPKVRRIVTNNAGSETLG